MLNPEAIDPRHLLQPFETPLWLPQYRSGRWGAWSIDVTFTAGSRSYWGTVYPIMGIPILAGPTRDGHRTWMSIIPMEIESQEIGIAAAHGHTVVLGLGMGWCAANVALNPAVTQVTVVERDPDVIAMIEAQSVFAQLPIAAQMKIRIVQDDAFDWRPDSRVDTLQADIWAGVVEPGKWGDVERLQRRIEARSIYFWGQEMEVWRLACRAAGGVPDDLDRASLDRLVAQTGLPLILSSDEALPAKIVAGARWWTPQSSGWWDARDDI